MEQFLGYLCFCLQHVHTCSPKFTPFQLMFNQTATIPINIELRKKNGEYLAVAYHQLSKVDNVKRGSRGKKNFRRGKKEHFTYTAETKRSV